MKNQKELAALLRAYHAAKASADTAKTISNEIKAEMAERKETKIKAGGFIASISTFESKSFDSAAFKADHPDLYAQYVKSSVTTRLNFK